MIDKLERKFGKYAIKNLIYYILGAYVIGYILYLAKPEWYSVIVMDPAMIMRGQVWRLFTWVCTVPQGVSIFLIFMFLFYFFIGRTLEQTMGAFRYNLYIFSGWLFTTVGGMILYWITTAINGPGAGISINASTYYLNLTSFLTFAVFYPDTRVLFFGIIPVRMKILAWIDAGYLTIQVLSGLIIALSPTSVVSQALSLYYGAPPSDLEISIIRTSSITLIFTIMISMLNFFIFFMMSWKKRAENKKRREEFYKKAQQDEPSGQYGSADPGWWNRDRQEDAYAQRTQTRQDERARKETETKGQYGAGTAGALVHRCSVCGRTNIENPELMFRYCSKCAGNHEYCQDHLFTHEHVK